MDASAEYLLEEMIGNEVVATHSLRDGASIEIANVNVDRLRLSKSDGLLPTEFALEQNYPNPFNPTTDIRFALPEKSEVSLVIYNSLGQKVRTLLSANKEAGFHTVTWDATNDLGNQVSSGIYLYRFTAGNHTAMKKMVLLK